MGTSQQCANQKGCHVDEKTAEVMCWETHRTSTERHSKHLKRRVRKEDQ